MEYVCPICNGLTEGVNHCKNCNTLMKNGGRIQDFYDDYSPYLSYNITDLMDDESHSICQHIFTCPVCGFDEVINIKKEYI